MSFEFLNALKRQLVSLDNDGYDDLEGEDIDYEYSQTSLLNFFARSSFLRKEREDIVIELFNSSYEEDPINTIKLLFYIRDKREGLGERKVFRTLLKYLGNCNNSFIKENLNLIPLYGRWDDLYALFNTPLEDDAISFIKRKLEEDLNSDRPSTLCKWLKSENTSSKDSRALGKKTRKLLKLSSKEYRTILSNIRKRLKIVEISMSSNRWENIQYGNLSSSTMNKYFKAFFRHDKTRITEYFQLNRTISNTIKSKFDFNEEYPFNIVENIIKGRYNSEEINFTDYVGEHNGDSLIVFGISETTLLKDKNYDPLYAGIGTTLYFLSKNKGRFKDHIITLNPKPNLKRIKDLAVQDKIEDIVKSNICNNIGVEAALDLILFAAIKHSLSNDELPRRLIFITDNKCNLSMLNKHHHKDTPYFINAEEYENIKEKWELTDYIIPELSFWSIDNVREDSTILKDTNSFIYAFGYSHDVFTSILKGECITTRDLMNEVLNKVRYNKMIIPEKY